MTDTVETKKVYENIDVEMLKEMAKVAKVKGKEDTVMLMSIKGS